MNHSAYLFGKFGFGYTQYPDDYAKDILKSVATNNKVKTQVDTESDSTKGSGRLYCKKGLHQRELLDPLCRSRCC